MGRGDRPTRPVMDGGVQGEPAPLQSAEFGHQGGKGASA